MTNPAAVRKLEELSLTGLPALESETFDGWILRAAGGYTRRANSAMPLEPGSRPQEEKIHYCERWYRERGLPTLLRLTPIAEPPGLDEELDRRGYVPRDGEVSVRWRPIDGHDHPVEAVVVKTGAAPEEWVQTLARFQERVAADLPTVRRVLSRLPTQSAFAMIRNHAAPAAIGRAVYQDGYVGIFDIFTRPDLRRRGLATDLSLALLGWGARHGATRAWLQVLAANDEAHLLYQRLGFREEYRYWYRRAPDSPTRAAL